MNTHKSEKFHAKTETEGSGMHGFSEWRARFVGGS
jgi:hypothetical protein